MTHYFVKRGSEFYTNQDIYDRRGTLLISKGQKITSNVRNRLEMIVKIDPEKIKDADHIQDALIALHNRQNTERTPVRKEFVKKMNIRNNRILEKPNEVLINIIFESKTKPWWIYVNALSNYVDWLYTHSIDVSIISLMMAVELGYSDEALTNLGIGALLHDVGKLLIPKSILQKPVSLTDTEMSLVRQHCELGVSSLKSFNLPKEYMDIVLQHHERLDGTGYPKGLKGEEISYNSRIVMIADAVDAITAYRPYRQPQSLEMAIKIIKKEKGKYSQELISLLEKILQ